VTARRGLAGAALVALAAAWLAAALYLWRTSVPELDLDGLDPRRYFGAEELDETADYERFLHIDYALADLVLLIVLGLYAWRGAAFTRESAAGRIGTGMLLGMLGFALVWLAQVPFQMAALWWDRRHDVTDMNYVELLFLNWFALGAEFLFLCFALLVVMGFAGPLRDRWWIAGAPVFVGLGVLFAFLFPYLATTEQRPLEGELGRKAKRLAAQQGVSDIEVRVETWSDVTDAPNAYAAGLGPSRKVVLWDTLLDGRFDDEEVEVVLAHEFAHHSRNHLWKAAGFFALFAFPGAFIVARLTQRRGGMRVPEAVPLSLFVLVVLELAAQPIFNEHSRRQEAEADWVALESTRRPEAAEELFESFTDYTMEQPNPPTWAYVWQNTHPSVMERIAMAEAWQERRR
jgi:STE24 endopeptidase